MDRLTSDAQTRRGSGPSPALLLSVIILVFATACGGLALSDLIGRISAIWVANAALVYFLLTQPQRDWLSIMAAGLGANFCADLVMGDNALAAGALTFCNAVGVLIIAAPLKFLELHSDFARPKPLLVFYALALGPAPFVAGLLSAAYFHFSYGRDFLSSALNWYATDALGYSIVVPMLMTVRVEALKKMFGRDQLAVTLLLLGTIAGTILLNFLARDYPLAFLFFPAIVLMTFQRGFAGGAIGLLMTGTYLMVPALIGNSSGVLGQHTEHEQIIIVQLFIAVMGFSVVLVGAALAERRQLEQGLAAAIVRAESSREEALVARDAADTANRMKSMFLATMSHELRTPLNAIIGFSELMHAQFYGPLGDARYQEYSGLIQRAGRHLLSLINDILDMSKIEAGKFELHRQTLDMRAVVRECLDLMRERASRGDVVLAEDLPETPLWLAADQRAMKQILLNLISNAVKFSHPNGRVAVRARIADSALILSVRDNGVGIPQDQLNRLGNPFVQVRSSAGASHEGTGLGLALVRALAELHSGTLKVESVLGQGTTVSIIIPAALGREECTTQQETLTRAG
ncbi:MAG: MASE1 domain-containing protein [Alphaproteobacteria bacterium]|nr:MASE1 domain-containing protein [Alphaproteobacteria bacterium]MDE2265594.1 MASE1 domain-containing protein [Alphaproteobacteria bacterium]MDE2501074.1 MASE1 domain-containing protein [Alphaproteobacteria bacterium]